MHDIARTLLMAAGGQSSGSISRTVGGYATGSLGPGTSYTTAALSIGAAAAARLVVVSATVRNFTGGTVPTTTGMTIGGIAATLVARYGGGAGFETSMWAALVPSGTTAVVAATLDRNTDEYALGILSLFGAIPTPAYTAANLGSPSGGDITAVKDGCVIAATGQTGGCFNGAVVTVNHNVDTGAPNYVGNQMASVLPTSSGLLYPLSSGTGAFPYVAASFAPL